MSQRVSDLECSQILKIACVLMMRAGKSDDCIRQVTEIGLDLQDARARIKELEALSASQAKALDMMDAGVKL
jgi:hypothetical protein